MPRTTLLVLPVAIATACHSYQPEPIDLRAHLAAFAARLPDSALRAPDAADEAPRPIDLADGLDLREARLVALCFAPACREARAAAGIAAREQEHAADWPAPTLSLDVARILETVPHQWLAGATLGFTVPLSGRLGLQQQLATAKLQEKVLAAYIIERATADAVDAAWVRWSIECQRIELLTGLCEQVQQLAAIAARLEQAGALTHLGARVFTIEGTQRELELANAQDAAAFAELELKKLLGLHPGAAVTFVPTTAITLREQDPGQRAARLDLSANVLPHHAAYQTAEAELKLAVRMQWPDLVLSPGWQEEDAEPRAALGLSVPLPFWSYAAIARASAVRLSAAESLRASLEVAVQTLALAELRWTQASRRRQFVTERLLPLADQQIADGRAMAELGQLDPVLLLDAIARAHDARLAALDATLREALAVIYINACCSLAADATPPVSGGL